MCEKKKFSLENLERPSWQNLFFFNHLFSSPKHRREEKERFGSEWIAFHFVTQKSHLPAYCNGGGLFLKTN